MNEHLPPLENPYAAPQTVEVASSPADAARTMRFSLGIGAWLMFLVSLVLPAAAPLEGFFNRLTTEAYPGYLCAFVYWPFYPSNLLMATLPLLLWLATRWQFRRWLTLSFAAFLFLSGVGALALNNSLFRDIGYWIWLMSFFPASLAWLLGTTASNRAASEAE